MLNIKTIEADNLKQKIYAQLTMLSERSELHSAVHKALGGKLIIINAREKTDEVVEVVRKWLGDLRSENASVS